MAALDLYHLGIKITLAASIVQNILKFCSESNTHFTLFALLCVVFQLSTCDGFPIHEIK